MIDLRVARYYLHRLHTLRPETKETWTLQHMLYAGMGGFVACYRSSAAALSEGKELSHDSITDISVQPEQKTHDTAQIKVETINDSIAQASETSASDLGKVDLTQQNKLVAEDQNTTNHDQASEHRQITPPTELWYLTPADLV